MKRPRIEPITASGMTVCGQKVLHFVDRPIHILGLEIIKTVTPAGRITVRKEDDVMYHTRVKKPALAN